jgi:DNA-binding transcriptional ArsR family regulator
MKTEAGLTLRQQADAIKHKHWNAQRLLLPLPVVIPFAEAIEFPDQWMRARRDNARFLNLIEVSAFVHQYQRERRNGAIVAGIADYAVAYRLARTILEGTLADLKLSLKEAYGKIRALFEEKGKPSLTRREIREALNMPDATLRNHLNELVQLEYLRAIEGGGQGSLVRYQLTEVTREPVSLGLLTPEDLKKKLGR